MMEALSTNSWSSLIIFVDIIPPFIFVTNVSFCYKYCNLNNNKKVDLDYQYQAAKICSENGVEGYILVSSSAASSKSQNKYLKMKGELEEKVKELSFKSIVFFRPSLLLGNRDEFRAAEKIGGFLMPVLSVIPGLRKYRPIKGEIVAEKMVKLSKMPDPGLQIYELDQIFSC